MPASVRRKVDGCVFQIFLIRVGLPAPIPRAPAPSSQSATSWRFCAGSCLANPNYGLRNNIILLHPPACPTKESRHSVLAGGWRGSWRRPAVRLAVGVGLRGAEGIRRGTYAPVCLKNRSFEKLI